jgi:NAD(P)-dependent dehydrogenase (short-subunit alcohol dehydrogenase family)
MTRRTAVVTDASSRIGAASARALARAGFTVFCAARRTDRVASSPWRRTSRSTKATTRAGTTRWPPVCGLLVADDLYVASENAVSVYTLDGARLATVAL